MEMENNVLQITRRKTTKRNLDNLNMKLENHIWELDPLSFDESFTIFFKTLHNLFYESCPLQNKSQNGTPKNKWITNEIKKHKEELRTIFWTHRQLNSAESKKIYKIKKKNYEKMISQAKRNHLSSLITNSSNPSKTIWSIVNKKLGRNYITPLNAPDSNELGEFFSTVVKDKMLIHFDDEISTSPTVCPLVGNTMFCEPTTPAEVRSAIKNLKNKSSGPEGIPAHVIKYISENLVEVISDLCNMSFEQGSFPAALKISCVIPILKSGNSSEASNYRPICILHVISKIIERIMFNRIMQFLNKYNVLSDTQHGFRANRSTDRKSVV